MARIPPHMTSIPTPKGAPPFWLRYVPKRLLSSKMWDRKQLWVITPDSWDLKEQFTETYEKLVNEQANSGGIGVVVYNLEIGSFYTSDWREQVLPIVEMHSRLHQNGSYAKWLIKAFIIVPNELAYCTIKTLMGNVWRPTRPLDVVSCWDELEVYLKELWLPRTSS